MRTVLLFVACAIACGVHAQENNFGKTLDQVMADMRQYNWWQLDKIDETDKRFVTATYINLNPEEMGIDQPPAMGYMFTSGSNICWGKTLLGFPVSVLPQAIESLNSLFKRGSGFNWTDTKTGNTIRITVTDGEFDVMITSAKHILPLTQSLIQTPKTTK